MLDQENEISNATGCPKCGSGSVSPVGFTWWGGILGPKMFHHTKCESCNYKFNSKTRKSNELGIAIYTLVGFAVAFLAYYFITRA